MYAGAYSYGRHPTDPRRKIPGRPGTGRTTASMNQWQVLMKDHLPAYISWCQWRLKRAVFRRSGELVLGGRRPWMWFFPIGA
jgi:hypothetical protein